MCDIGIVSKNKLNAGLSKMYLDITKNMDWNVAFAKNWTA
jgi:hypothetical protein